MQRTLEKIRERFDPVLLFALLAAFVFCLIGIRWGRVEDWNPDQMAMRGLSWRLEPHDFQKPPFHIFLNHVLVLWPLSLAEFGTRIMTHRAQDFGELKLLASRLVLTAMYLGTVVIAFKTADIFYGRRAARIITLLYATSAGFFVYEHFLTADTPVVFWMMLAMMFATRIILAPTTANYMAAGFCTGLATATKYNGLAIGLAIPVAHVLAQTWNWRAFLPNRRLCIGLLMVLVGFILGNPYAVFDWPKFRADFAYNYVVAPRYNGETGLGFGKFALGIFNILGLPGGILIVALVIVSALLLVRQKSDERATKCYLLLAGVFVLYALKFGSFPRVPTRFVLPAIPFLILMSGPALHSRFARGRWLYALLVPILIYNCVCSFYVGKRFRDDPRMAAQDWMEANVRPGSRIESSAGSPHWTDLPRLNAVQFSVQKVNWGRVRRNQTIDLRMPRPNSRFERFSKIFAGDEEVVEAARQREKPPDLEQYTLEQLQERNPDYITVYSGDSHTAIDAIRHYYDELLNETFPYRIAFDGSSPQVPRWIYPQDIDHQNGRITILARRADAATR